MGTISTLSALNAQAGLLRVQMDLQTQQVSTGYKGSTYSALSRSTALVVNLQGTIARTSTYNTSLSQASARAGVMQNALSQISSIAQNFYANVTVSMNSRDPASVANYADQAKKAMVEIGQLLNTQYAGEYVFGGTDTANPPVPDAANILSSGMASDIASAIGSFDGTNLSTVLSATMAAASSNVAGTSPFSAFLTDSATGGAEAARSVVSGDGQSIRYGISANRNAVASSSGDTTGSWAKDLLRGLASIAAMDSSTAAQPDFDSLVSSLHSQFQSAYNALSDEAGGLGQAQAAMTTAQTTNTSLVTVLKSQVSDLSEVDMADALTRLQATQTALEASYQAIASLRQLSLVNYL